MEYRVENGRLVVELTGKVDSGNADDVEDQLGKALADCGLDELVLDASGLEYISSAGLRVLLKLRRRLSSLVVVEASPEVYDVFQMTGLTELMDVRKRMRTISVKGCELIGRGGNGAVYRLDAETIVKVYYGTGETLEKIQASRRSAQKLLACGIPVAIAFDVVRTDEGYGLVYELLNCKTLGELIHEDPSKAEYWAQRAAELLRLLHTTEVPAGTFPDARDSGHHWVELAKGVLSEEEQARLHRIYDSMPACNTLVHGDFHVGNMMVQDDEIILIDTDDVAQGDPVIDLAGMSLTFEGITTDQMSMSILGITVDEKKRYFDAFLKNYYQTDDEELISRLYFACKPHALIKQLYGICKTDKLTQEQKDAYIPQMRAGLLQLLDAMGM